MKTEILFPEFLLYGDRGNAEYLEKALGKDNVVYTHFSDKPYFADNDVNMVYMGPMTEKQLEMVTEKMLPYADRIKEMIEKGVVFLIVGTALEMFGQYIGLTNGFRLKTLKTFPFTTNRNMSDRHDVAVLGDFDGMKIMGYDARFTEQYGNEDMAFLEVERGHGFNRKSRHEGIHYKNFFGTNLYGPILITNPPFTKYLLKLMNVTDELPFEETAMRAYGIRLEKFLTEKEFMNQH